MTNLPCRMVFRSNQEQLWIWDDKKKAWIQPAVFAVSGGGRGLKPKYGGTYGAHNERKFTGRFSNMGGPSWPGADPRLFGTIPNGVFRVEHPHHSKTLGWCAALHPVQGIMMGRGSFFIHGEGKIGSEGCIIPVNPKIGPVLHLISMMLSKGPLYLRVEGSNIRDLPDMPLILGVA